MGSTTTSTSGPSTSAQRIGRYIRENLRLSHSSPMTIRPSISNVLSASAIARVRRSVEHWQNHPTRSNVRQPKRPFPSPAPNPTNIARKLFIKTVHHFVLKTIASELASPNNPSLPANQLHSRQHATLQNLHVHTANVLQGSRSPPAAPTAAANQHDLFISRQLHFSRQYFRQRHQIGFGNVSLIVFTWFAHINDVGDGRNGRFCAVAIPCCSRMKQCPQSQWLHRHNVVPFCII